MGTTYSTATIAADRGQRSFSLSLDQFLAKRGGSAIVARGRALKQSNAALFASIQQRFGVPPGPLLAIWPWVVDRAHIARQRLMIATRKRILAWMAPRKYGDQ